MLQGLRTALHVIPRIHRQITIQGNVPIAIVHPDGAVPNLITAETRTASRATLKMHHRTTIMANVQHATAQINGAVLHSRIMA
jgi:hypothetical protein